MQKTISKKPAEDCPDAKDLEIRAPQEIIHIKHKISLRQYKFWIVLLQEFKNQFDAGNPPDEDGLYSISMDSIVDKIGYLPVKKEFKNDLSSIRLEPICINTLSKNGQSEYYEAGFISEFKITTKKIKFKFPSFLEKVMKGKEFEKNMFTLLNWRIFNHFTGKHEAIIYKLCKDYINSPGRRTPKMTIDKFREYMGINPGEYPEFKKLNARVILEPVKRINDSEISDILITPNFEKDGRKVTGLYFSVEHKKQTALPFFDTDEDNIFKFAKVPIDKKQQELYLKIRPKEEIILAIERANEYSEELEKIGKPVNYGGMLKKSIELGWTPKRLEKEIQKEAKAKETQKETKAKEIQKEKEKEKFDDEKKITDSIMQEFNSLDEKEKEQLRTIYENSGISSQAIASIWKKQKALGLPPENHFMITSLFSRFYETYKANLKLDI